MDLGQCLHQVFLDHARRHAQLAGHFSVGLSVQIVHDKRLVGLVRQALQGSTDLLQGLKRLQDFFRRGKPFKASAARASSAR